MSIWSSRATMQTARRREEQGPRCSSGDATPQVRKHAFKCGAVARSRVAPTRVYAQALLRRPRALATTRVGRGAEQWLRHCAPILAGVRPAVGKRPLRGASLCREPSQYRHVASGPSPRPASHIASVAHVPIIEIGSSHGITRKHTDRLSRRRPGPDRPFPMSSFDFCPKSSMPFRVFPWLTLWLLAVLSFDSAAQAYPNRSVRIISPFAAGGSNDVIARVIAPRLTAVLGQPFIV